MIFQAAVGQAEKVILAAQYLDNNAEPETPLSPQAVVYGGAPMTAIATLTPMELPGVTGFMIAELDVSNATAFPAGQYVVRWTGITSDAPTSIVGYLQIVLTTLITSSGVIGSSYTSEDRIRKVNKLLEDTEVVPSNHVALEAVRAAEWINGHLAAMYPVPFVPVFDPIIVLLNDWWAAANLLDWRYGENGNLSDHAKMLREWCEHMIDAILDGSTELTGVEPIDETAHGGGYAASRYAKQSSQTMPGIKATRGTERR